MWRTSVLEWMMKAPPNHKHPVLLAPPSLNHRRIYISNFPGDAEGTDMESSGTFHIPFNRTLNISDDQESSSGPGQLLPARKRRVSYQWSPWVTTWGSIKVTSPFIWCRSNCFIGARDVKIFLKGSNTHVNLSVYTESQNQNLQLRGHLSETISFD